MDSLKKTDYINTSYKLRMCHIWNGLMNDLNLNPVCLAFKDALGDDRFFACTGEIMIIAQTENDYNNGDFVDFRLSFKMREFIKNFNNDVKVEPMVMCVSEVPGTDELFLYLFEENWRRVYEER